ncbi:glucose-6-phosphate dehydrogenase, partial [Streptomyces minutiscleroticus]|uniref:glucose-6-phosphate dehydrogenase n=2 Tax=Streptomyces minutiscleroticus TaxID=68238 RepID=UPI001E30704C
MRKKRQDSTATAGEPTEGSAGATAAGAGASAADPGSTVTPAKADAAGAAEPAADPATDRETADAAGERAAVEAAGELTAEASDRAAAGAADEEADAAGAEGETLPKSAEESLSVEQALAGALGPDWDNPLRDARDRRLPRIAGPSGLVIFGVTGDLSRKKLMPAVYDLANRGLLPPGFSLVGFARREWEDQDFAQVVHEAVREHARTPFREEVWQQLAEGMRFIPGDFDDDAAFEQLREAVDELDASRGTNGNYAFYLSVPPKFFPKVVQQLKRHGLAKSSEGSWRRAVIEKPFGRDLASARELNKIVHEVFDPDQVFRIDHYLGKETVQNILALRFANQMYEPIWNRSYVDHVQITMAEDIGIGGRAGYYDGI